jgi:hypothetical protein
MRSSTLNGFATNASAPSFAALARSFGLESA